MSVSSLSILLVDDHELFRSGLKLLLGDMDENLSFAEASSCSQALELAAGNKFDIVLIDLDLPDSSGLDALALLRPKLEDTMIIVVSPEESHQVIFQTIEAGAAGFIPKSSSQAIMLAALRLVLAGGIYLPANLVPVRPRSQETDFENVADQEMNLTGRQVEALRMVMQGKTNKAIAGELNITEAAVKARLTSTFRALGVKNRTEAVSAAGKLGL